MMTSLQWLVWGKKIFRFFSSVKLAVPLMIVLVAAVSVGTIIESRYNADMAKIQIYQSRWFFILLVLLWINIFCAALSRWPWKRHHTGFVITHLGLLTLLVGSLMTLQQGIDGQLRVREGHQASEVILNDLVLEYRPVGGNSSVSHPLKRTLTPSDPSWIKEINQALFGRFRVEDYYPFSEVSQGYALSLRDGAGMAVQVELQSPMFQVREWLHSRIHPTLNLGPATLRLITDTPAPKKPITQKPQPPTGSTPKPIAAQKKSKSQVALLIGTDSKSQVEIFRIPVQRLKAEKSVSTPSGVQIQLRRLFEDASVGQGGLQDGGTPGKNPALELQISKGELSFREVTFARFPDFSLNANNPLGIKLAYQAPEYAGDSGGPNTDMPQDANHQMIETHGNSGSQGAPAQHSGGNMAVGGNIIEFRPDPTQPEWIEVTLKKNNAVVLKKSLGVGQTLETPWMGMKITIQSLLKNAEAQNQVQAIAHPERSDLPPAAIKIAAANGGPGGAIWLVEGEAQILEAGGQNFEVYFGRQIIQLPFQVLLEKFSKIDYPGTSTPMSFESAVRIGGNSGSPVTISMNEPHKEQGFTLYQSSYIQQPGQPTYSIFSVNQDPGRPVKYIGSIILCLGIAIFTLMRSRLTRQNLPEAK